MWLGTVYCGRVSWEMNKLASRWSDMEISSEERNIALALFSVHDTQQTSHCCVSSRGMIRFDYKQQVLYNLGVPVWCCKQDRALETFKLIL